MEGYHGKGLKEKSLYRANMEATFLALTAQEKTEPRKQRGRRHQAVKLGPRVCTRPKQRGIAEVLAGLSVDPW